MCPGFVHHPLLTQRNFFSATGISMLNTAIAAADAVRDSSKFNPWRAIGAETGSVIVDLLSCREKVVLRRKTVEGTRERWFGADTVASSAIGEAVPCTTVRISDVVEVGEVQFDNEHHKLGLLGCSRSTPSPGKDEKKRNPVSHVVPK